MQRVLTSKTFSNKLIFSLGIFFVFLTILFPHTSKAEALLAGNISTCGELIESGTYTLTQNVTTSGTSTCFTISADNITINGAGFSITGTGTTSIAIDARARDGGPTSNLTEGSNGYTNLLISNLTITGFTTGINTSGNSDTTGTGVKSGNGGDGGDVAIYYSTVGSITSQGGNSTTKSYGGTGGNVFFEDINLNISNSAISLEGGTGTVGRYTDGGLDLNYTGTLTKTNVSFSPLSFLNDNGTSYTTYAGGTWPILPGTISTCGTLYGPGTFTLSQNVTSTSTCFIIASNSVTIDGNGYSIIANNASTTDFAITAGNHSSTTIASTTITGFSNYINSSSSVTISGTNLDLSNKYIKAGLLSINYIGPLLYASTTFSNLTDLTFNGVSYGAFVAGTLRDFLFKGQQSPGSRNWRSITSSADGTRLAAVVSGGYVYTSTDSGNTWVQKTFDITRSW